MDLDLKQSLRSNARANSNISDLQAKYWLKIQSRRFQLPFRLVLELQRYNVLKKRWIYRRHA